VGIGDDDVFAGLDVQPGSRSADARVVVASDLEAGEVPARGKVEQRFGDARGHTAGRQTVERKALAACAANGGNHNTGWQNTRAVEVERVISADRILDDRDRGVLDIGVGDDDVFARLHV